jgi:hypothetical protein
VRFVFFLTALLAASVSFGADGDEVTPREAHRSIYYMCDSDTANSTCDTIEIPTEISGARISINNETACTAYTVTISDSATSGAGVWHTLGTLVFGGTSSLSIDTNTTHKYIRAVSTGEIGCTDLDVVIEFFGKKN